MNKVSNVFLAALAVGLWPAAALAATAAAIDMTDHWVGWAGLGLFVLAYWLVIVEETTHLRKSKPVIIAAGIMWAMIAVVYGQQGKTAQAETAIRHVLLEYGELLLFLLVAMTYVNALEERRVFVALRAWLVRSGFSFRVLFWLTGVLAFFISPVADNLTTALLMAAVVMAVGGDKPEFVVPSCISIVVGANAGGAFSPFGDITTLMVWQKGMVDFAEFFVLFIPAVVNFMIPALIMQFAIPAGRPARSDERIEIRQGGLVILALFVATIASAVLCHNLLGMPPVLGMMTGLGYLQIFGYFLKRSETRRSLVEHGVFDVFHPIARVEWDTLLFFYGVMMCVGALGVMGHLGLLSRLLYGEMGPTIANISIGLLSAILDNIPLMFAVLTMQPDMSHGQWLLITLTAGVGGSLLSIGSAAGVGVMGQARGVYTFSAHLKWSPAIALGYAGSVAAHMVLNRGLF